MRLVAAMLFSAFAAPECYHCGKIPRHEFPKEARIKLGLASAAVIATAIGLLICAIVLASPTRK